MDDRKPEVYLSHPTNKINFGASEWVYIDIYIPRNTSYKYELEVMTGISSEAYGTYDLIL